MACPSSSSRLDSMVKGLSENGMTVDFRRRMNDGTYENASERDLSLLSTQANIASSAHNMQSLPAAEKLIDALSVKEEGNSHFKNGDFIRANELYLQALAASDFGKQDGSDQGNVDELVIPVLTNMAACCLQTKEYVKVARFCEQALLLRPGHAKALLRSGIAFYYLKEYDKAIANLESVRSIMQADEVSLQPAASTRTADLSKVNSYLSKAKHDRRDENLRLKQQKQSLQRAFASGPYQSPPLPHRKEGHTVIAVTWTVALKWGHIALSALYSLLGYILHLICTLLGPLVPSVSKKLD